MAQTSLPGAAHDLNPSGRRSVMLVGEGPEGAELVSRTLAAAGYEVSCATTGAEAEAMLERVQPDLIMLGIVLPDVDGLVLCAQLLTRSTAPIVMLSGTKRHRDRILSLRLGADDFIAEPFDPPELIARVDAVLRRAPRLRLQRAAGWAGRSPSEESMPWSAGGLGGVPSAGVPHASTSARRVHEFGELVLDHLRRSVAVGGTPIHLTPTEHRVLSLLISAPGHVFDRGALAKAIWGHANLGESRAIDVHIRRLRSKLEPFGGHAPIIVTVRGFGYKVAPSLAANDPLLQARPDQDWASTDSQPQPFRNNCAGVSSC